MPTYKVVNKPYDGREPGSTFSSEETDAVKRAVSRGSLEPVREEKQETKKKSAFGL